LHEHTYTQGNGVYLLTRTSMKHTIRCILASVLACAVGSLVTYRIAYHRGYEDGYKSGLFCGIRQGSFGQSLGFLAGLQQLRAGDTPRATRMMEQFCFSSAQTYYKDPTPSPGEASDWGRAQGLSRFPGPAEAKTLAKGLVEYRAAYRTNSADWGLIEQKLAVELAKAK
jgi:hypothetical protein